MARLVSWAIVVLAFLGVASLASLPLLASGAAERVDLARPKALLPKPQIPEEREEPLVPVSELHEALRLPRVDTTPTDEHSRTSLAAYHDGNYKKAFEEAVLSLDPTPLEENRLYQFFGRRSSRSNLSPEAVSMTYRSVGLSVSMVRAYHDLEGRRIQFAPLHVLSQVFSATTRVEQFASSSGS